MWKNRPVKRQLTEWCGRIDQLKDNLPNAEGIDQLKRQLTECEGIDQLKDNLPNTKESTISKTTYRTRRNLQLTKKTTTYQMRRNYELKDNLLNAPFWCRKIHLLNDKK
jgi:hypothetical protein